MIILYQFLTLTFFATLIYRLDPRRWRRYCPKRPPQLGARTGGRGVQLSGCPYVFAIGDAAEHAAKNIVRLIEERGLSLEAYTLPPLGTTVSVGLVGICRSSGSPALMLTYPEVQGLRKPDERADLREDLEHERHAEVVGFNVYHRMT